MNRSLANATNFCQTLNEYNEKHIDGGKDIHRLRYNLEGWYNPFSVMVRVNAYGGISSHELQMILDHAELTKGKVIFEQTGEISVTFS